MSTTVADPRKQWPEHARKLYGHLVALYGADGTLPALASGWVANKRSATPNARTPAASASSTAPE